MNVDDDNMMRWHNYLQKVVNTPTCTLVVATIYIKNFGNTQKAGAPAKKVGSKQRKSK